MLLTQKIEPAHDIAVGRLENRGPVLTGCVADPAPMRQSKDILGIPFDRHVSDRAKSATLDDETYCVAGCAVAPR